MRMHESSIHSRQWMDESVGLDRVNHDREVRDAVCNIALTAAQTCTPRNFFYRQGPASHRYRSIWKASRIYDRTSVDYRFS